MGFRERCIRRGMTVEEYERRRRSLCNIAKRTARLMVRDWAVRGGYLPTARYVYLENKDVDFILSEIESYGVSFYANGSVFSCENVLIL